MESDHNIARTYQTVPLTTDADGNLVSEEVFIPLHNPVPYDEANVANWMIRFGVPNTDGITSYLSGFHYDGVWTANTPITNFAEYAGTMVPDLSNQISFSRDGDNVIATLNCPTSQEYINEARLFSENNGTPGIQEDDDLLLSMGTGISYEDANGDGINDLIFNLSGADLSNGVYVKFGEDNGSGTFITHGIYTSPHFDNAGNLVIDPAEHLPERAPSSDHIYIGQPEHVMNAAGLVEKLVFPVSYTGTLNSIPDRFTLITDVDPSDGDVRYVSRTGVYATENIGQRFDTELAFPSEPDAPKSTTVEYAFTTPVDPAAELHATAFVYEPAVDPVWGYNDGMHTSTVAQYTHRPLDSFAAWSTPIVVPPVTTPSGVTFDGKLLDSDARFNAISASYDPTNNALTEVVYQAKDFNPALDPDWVRGVGLFYDANENHQVDAGEFLGFGDSDLNPNGVVSFDLSSLTWPTGAIVPKYDDAATLENVYAAMGIYNPAGSQFVAQNGLAVPLDQSIRWMSPTPITRP